MARSGNRRQSTLIRGEQRKRQSDALRCAQMHSDALRCTQMHSDALRGTQMHSEALRGTQRHSEALTDTHRHSQTLTDTHRHSQTLTETHSGALTEALRGTPRHSVFLSHPHLRLPECPCPRPVTWLLAPLPKRSRMPRLTVISGHIDAHYAASTAGPSEALDVYSRWRLWPSRLLFRLLARLHFDARVRGGGDDG